jgi:hypothetical protein
MIHFEMHTFKARSLMLQERMEDATDCLVFLDKLAMQLDLIPFYDSDYRISRAIYRIMKMEDDLVNGSEKSSRGVRKEARNEIKGAIRASSFFKRDRTEALRLAGTRRWLLGMAAAQGLLGFGKFLSGPRALRHYRAAIRWWKKSIDIGMRLGARLELSRTYAEIGKRLGGRYLHLDADPGGTPHHHARLPRELVRAHVYAEKRLGLSPEECLAKAEAMFREMDLQWDLAELEKVRDSMEKIN